MVQCNQFWWSFFCFVFVKSNSFALMSLCDPVHDVETIHGLYYLLTASENYF